jgi:hypothetical protein
MTIPPDLPAPDPRPVVRLSSPPQVVDALPVLLGFRPSESLVLLSLVAGGKRLGLTVRADLEDCWRDDDFASRTAGALARNGAEAALLVVVTDEGVDPDQPLPASELVDEVVAALEDEGVELREQLLVTDGRWWSYSCSGPCCPPEGTPVLQGTSELAAQAVLEGRVVLPDRAALAATITGPLPGSDAARRREEQLADRDLLLAEEVLLHAGSRAWLHDHALRVVTAFRALMVRPIPPSEDELLTMLVGLDSVEVRDAVLMALPDADLRDAERLLVRLLQAAVPPWTLVPAAMLAHCTWRSGGGALTNLALDRVVEVDPGSVMAQQIGLAMRFGVKSGPEHGVAPDPESAVRQALGLARPASLRAASGQGPVPRRRERRAALRAERRRAG